MPRTPKATVTVGDQTVTFTFAHGPSLEADLGRVPSPIYKRLALHGLEQKLRDSYAGVDTPEEALAAATAVWETLVAGEWSKRREGAPSEPPIALLEKAVATVLQRKKKPVPADLRARLEAMSRSDRAKLRAVPEIAAEIAREKGVKADVLDSLLA